MADQKGTPIHAPPAPTRPHAQTSADARPRCEACGADHGPVGQHIECLSNKVKELRAVLSALKGGSP